MPDITVNLTLKISLEDEEKAYNKFMGRVHREMVFIRSAEIFGKRSGNNFAIVGNKYCYLGTW